MDCPWSIHLKQFVKGELYDYEDETVQWKTKRYKLHMAYDDMPWEREAYRLETKLYDKWEGCVWWNTSTD